MLDINRPVPNTYCDGRSITPRRINLAILTYNALDSTKLCLESLARNTPHDFNIFILDNGSKDDTRKWLSEQRSPNLVYELGQDNLGVPGGRNRLIRMITPHLPAEGFVVFTDNDMELLAGWSDVYLSFFAEHPEVGIASAHGQPMVVHQDRRSLLALPRHTAPVDVGCGGFACWIRAATLKAVGDFDQKLGLFWHEDDDYSVRAIAAGWEVFVLPHAPVIHHEHKSGVASPDIYRDGSPDNQKYLCHKWREMGVIDACGRVIHKQKTPQAESELEIVEGVWARGVDRDSGGYRPVQRQAQFRLESKVLMRQRQLAFRLRCYESGVYSRFPFNFEISAAGRLLKRGQFTQSNQEIEVELPLEGVGTEQLLDLRFDAAFTPVLADLDHWDYRALSAYISNVKLGDAEAAQAEGGVAQIRGDTDEDGVLLIAPTLRFGEEGFLSRELARALVRNGIATQVISSSMDQYFTLSLRSDRQSWEEHHQFFSRKVRSGTLICAFPQVRSDKLPVFSMLRDSYPNFARYVGIISNAADLPCTHLLSECRKLDQVWFVSEYTRESFIAAGLPPEKALLMPMPAAAGVPDLAARQPQAPFTFAAFVNWDSRSAWDVVVRAFLSAFVPGEEVRLALKHNYLDAEPVLGLMQRFLEISGNDPARIVQFESAKASANDREEYEFLARLDCLVNVQRFDPVPYRTKLAVLAGKPLILLEAGPLLELSREFGAYRVEPNGRCAISDEQLGLKDLYPAQAAWFEPTISSVAGQMRQVFESARSGRLDAAKSERGAAQHELFAAWIKQHVLTEIKPSTVLREFDQDLEPLSSAPKSALPLVTVAGSLSIGVDARTLIFSETAQRGIGHYTVNHLDKLAQLTPDWRYCLFLEGDSEEEHIKRLLKHPNVSVAYFDRPQPKIDLYHIPDAMSLIAGFDSPFRLAPGAPTSVVFYDLIPLAVRKNHFDAWDKSRQVVYLKRLQQLKESGALVLSISEHTRRDLIEHTQIAAERVVTIMAGPNKSVSTPMPPWEEVQELFQRIDLAPPFFLSVGGLDPHKEFTTTALAFIAASKFKPMQLVIVGSSNDPYKDAYRNLFEKYPCGKAIFTGYLTDAELKALYASATALIFPSRYEGFGLPVLEAMASGCPVIASNASSIPEVAGDAALLTAPGDIEQAAQHMLRLLEDQPLRENLIRLGRLQAEKFSWDKVASTTIAAWKNYLSQTQVQGAHTHSAQKNLQQLVM